MDPKARFVALRNHAAELAAVNLDREIQTQSKLEITYERSAKRLRGEMAKKASFVARKVSDLAKDHVLVIFTSKLLLASPEMIELTVANASQIIEKLTGFAHQALDLVKEEKANEVIEPYCAEFERIVVFLTPYCALETTTPFTEDAIDKFASTIEAMAPPGESVTMRLTALSDVSYPLVLTATATPNMYVVVNDKCDAIEVLGAIKGKYEHMLPMMLNGELMAVRYGERVNGKCSCDLIDRCGSVIKHFGYHLFAKEQELTTIVNAATGRTAVVMCLYDESGLTVHWFWTDDLKTESRFMGLDYEAYWGARYGTVVCKNGELCTILSFV